MVRYGVEFYKKNLTIRDAKPSGPYELDVEGDNFEEATARILPELIRIGFMSGHNDIWNARIIGPEDESYEILREGSWLVDLETGRRLEQRIH